MCRKLFEKGYVKLIEKEIVPDLDGIMLKSIDKKIKYTNYQKSAINNVCSSIEKNKFSLFYYMESLIVEKQKYILKQLDMLSAKIKQF